MKRIGKQTKTYAVWIYSQFGFELLCESDNKLDVVAYRRKWGIRKNNPEFPYDYRLIKIKKETL